MRKSKRLEFLFWKVINCLGMGIVKAFILINMLLEIVLLLFLSHVYVIISVLIIVKTHYFDFINIVFSA